MRLSTVAKLRRFYICIILITFFSLTLLYYHSTISRLALRFSVSPRSTTASPTKYLTYLPHSGLSNQRIELANALLMASILDRTLIIPPAFLGRVPGWNGKRRSMAWTLEWLTTPKDFDMLCTTAHDTQRISTYINSSKCQVYHDSGVIQWSDLHNLESLRPYVSFQYSNTISLDHLSSSLGLCRQQQNGKNDINCGEDIYVHYDKVRHDWRVYDDDKLRYDLHINQGNYVRGQHGKKEFYQLTSWKDWQQRSERLLYLGSIFGTTRLNVVHPGHVALKHRIKSALIYRMDSPLGETVSLIVKDYLENKNYLAVHFRTMDKSFRNDIVMQVENTSKQIERTLILLDQQVPTSFCPLNSSTRKISSNSIMANVYMATDHTHPKDNNSTLVPWFDRYPCTITLNDIPPAYFKPLDMVHDLIQTTKPLKQLLMPLIDSMVAAHSVYPVSLTPGSTFSSYIGQLHDAWSQDSSSSRLNTLPSF